MADTIRLSQAIMDLRERAETKDFDMFFWPQLIAGVKKVYVCVFIVKKTIYVYENYKYAYTIISASENFKEKFDQKNLPFLDQYNLAPYKYDESLNAMPNRASKIGINRSEDTGNIIKGRGILDCIRKKK